MADWQEAVQASVIALIFALMVAKLVSVVISFRGENLRVEREAPEKELLLMSDMEEEEAEEEAAAFTEETSSSSDEESENGGEGDDAEVEDKVLAEAEENVVGEKTEPVTIEGETREDQKGPRDADVGLHALVEDHTKQNSSSDVDEEEVEKEVDSGTANVEPEDRKPEVKDEGEEKKIKKTIEASGELISDSDDWEGVESSELEETFGAAATFVATGFGPGLKVSNDIQLLLYGLYKLATEGPCSTPQPSAYKMSARAKWNAWQKLGSIGQEEAMHRYIVVVSEICPNWAQGSQKTEEQAQDSAHGDASQRGGIGPVFSSLAGNDDGVEDGTLEAIHVCAREGDQAGLQQQIANGIPVDLKDSDGRTALHWAADRGHLQAVELLLEKGAQIHAKDAEGQTALHYATTCEQEEIAKYLVKNGAETFVQDNEGVSPISARPGHWTWMGVTT